jgi:hypothetical protein
VAATKLALSTAIQAVAILGIAFISLGFWCMRRTDADRAV